MNGRYLLDTNIVIAVLNREPAMIARLSGDPELFLSVITIGELLRGAYGSVRMQANLDRVRGLAQAHAIVPCTVATAEKYALVKQRLRARGRPLPDNDVWIAATAQQHGLTLITRDRHFEEVEDLALETW